MLQNINRPKVLRPLKLPINYNPQLIASCLKKIYIAFSLLIIGNSVCLAQVDLSKHLHPYQNSYDAKNFNFILNSMGAEFIQIPDSLTDAFFSEVNYQQKFKDNPINRFNFSALLRNNYTAKNRLDFSCELYPIKVELPDYTTRQLIKKLEKLNDKKKIDSLWNAQYLAKYNEIVGSMNVSLKSGCFLPKKNRRIAKLDKSVLHADSVVFFQSFFTSAKTCAGGYFKGYIIFKKDVGYITLFFANVQTLNSEKSIEETDRIFDKLIADT